MIKQVLLGVGKLRTRCDSVEGGVRLAKGSVPVQCLDGLGASTVTVPASDADGRDSQGMVAGGDRSPGDTAAPACR